MEEQTPKSTEQREIVEKTVSPEKGKRGGRSARARKRRRKRRLLAAFGILCLLVLGIYIGGRYFFQSHYFPNTVINGADCSLMNQDKAFAAASDRLSTYALTVHSEDGDLKVEARDVKLGYKDSKDLEVLLKGQDVDRWFMNLNSSFDYQVMETKLDDDSLIKSIRSLACMNPANPRESENPTLIYNEETGKYDVVAGKIGNHVNEETFTEAVKTAMLKEDEELDLLTNAYYLPSQYNESSEIIVKAREKADKYAGSVINYQDGDSSLTVSGKEISSFIKIDDQYQVSIDNDAVKKYIKENIAKKFGSGDLVIINSPGSGKIYVSDGSGDKVVNVPSEQKKLIKNIQSGKTTTRKPEYITDFLYSSRGSIVKDDYIDINLSKQQVYVVIGKKLQIQSPCVTGNVSAGRGSSTGIYKIAYKQRNHTMVKYNAFVYYWMPYETTYGIGLHDATWRGSFGGKIYRTNGSHGCINLPLAKAREIYNTIYAGIPVVVHY